MMTTEVEEILATTYEAKTVALPPVGRWSLLWFGVKPLPPGCMTCGNGLGPLVSQVTQDGCAIIGLSYDSPAENQEYMEDFLYAFPVMTVTSNEAALYDAHRPADSPYAGSPRRVAVLVRPDRTVAARYENVGDAQSLLRQVLKDMNEAATDDGEVGGEEPRTSVIGRLFGRR